MYTSPTTEGERPIPKVFVNYRRQDTAGHAGRLYDRLAAEFDDDAVFMDVRGIEAGADFADRIHATVTECDVLLAVIGPSWLAPGPTGDRRIDDPVDLVRAEIRSALVAGVPVIPLLVGGATMPTADQLPDDVRQLARTNALEISDARFSTDVDGLVATLRRIKPRQQRRVDGVSRPDVLVERRWALLAFALLGILAGFIVSRTALLDGAERSSVDTRFAMRGDRAADERIVIAALDDITFSELRLPVRPVQRRLYARALETLAPARLTVLDLFFNQKSDPYDDRVLIEAILAAGPKLVIGAAHTVGNTAVPAISWGAARVLESGARIGATALEIDATGKYREVSADRVGIPTIAFETAEALGEPQSPDLRNVPIDFAGPPGTYPTIPFSRFVTGDLDPERIRDKIVVVGYADPALQDVHPTPISDEPMVGAEIQANAIASALEGFPLRYSSSLTDVLLIVLAGLSGAALWMRTWRLLLLAPLLIGAFLVLAQLAFNGGRIIEMVPPATGFVVAFGGTGTYALARAQSGRRRARENLGRFAPPEVVAQLLSGESSPQLGGTNVEATVLVARLHGFEAIAETRSAPDVIAALNVFLGAASEAVRAEGGTVVSFLGAGLMAIFGAPAEQADHADRALATARRLRSESLTSVNAWLLGHGIADQVELAAGVSSGRVMSGIVGTEWRIEYAAVGDTTNVALGLEEATASYGTAVLIAGSTREFASDSSNLEPRGALNLEGHARPVDVWTFAS